MNKLKSNARILLILIVSAFIVIPIAAVLVSKLFGVQENMEDYNMSDKNTSMNRINMEGVEFENTDGNDATGGTDDYLYCIGGDIVCDDDDGTDTLQVDDNGGTYTDAGGGSGGSSYKSTCTNGANAVCKNNHVSTTNDNSISFYDSEGTEWPYYGPSNDKFKGYLGPYSYIPMKISDEYVYLYDRASQAYSSEAISACYLYGDCTDEASGDSTGDSTSDSTGDSTSDSTSDSTGDSTSDSTGDSTPENSNVSTMKCIADNGAKPGDPLCCGQDGILQDTKYNCHSDYPYCIGYKCGETWGKCSTTAQ